MAARHDEAGEHLRRVSVRNGINIEASADLLTLPVILNDELTSRAVVGRVTYFRSFSNKSEAITFKFIKMWEQYAELNDIKVRDRFDLDNALHFFQYNLSIRHILTLVYKAGQQEAIHESFYRIMTPTDRGDDTLTTYREKFYAHGLYGLLDEWIKRDFRETPEEMAALLRAIVSGNGGAA